MSDSDGHASHEACELKWLSVQAFDGLLYRHASHEACELKFLEIPLAFLELGVTPRMRRVS